MHYIRMEGPLDVSRIRPLVHVLCVTLLLTIPVMQGVFDGIHTNTAPDHYAEKAWPVLKDWAPWLVIMPANTVVNLCYIIVGIYWLLATKILVKAQTRRGKAASTDLTGHDVYMMYAFCWISIIYGPVQMARILMLKHRLAVLDQWYTLPGFAWVLVWALYNLRGWSVTTVIAVIGISISSYCLTLLHPLGFDFALACHIIVIVKYCFDVQQQYGTAAIYHRIVLFS